MPISLPHISSHRAWVRLKASAQGFFTTRFGESTTRRARKVFPASRAVSRARTFVALADITAA